MALSSNGVVEYGDQSTIKGLCENNGGIVYLYAQWEKVEYYISYEMNGGVMVDGGNYPLNTYNITENCEISDPQYASYPEYNHFVGWYEDKEFNNPFANDLSENPRDITLFAKWDLCTVYTTIDSSPWQPSGRVIFDWRNEKNTDLLKHTGRFVYNNRYNNFDVIADELVLIGTPQQVFNNLIFVLCCYGKGSSALIRFVDFKYVTNASAAIDLYADEGVNLTIDITGDCSIGTSYGGGNLIALGGRNLTLCGTGKLVLTAGNGNDGANGARYNSSYSWKDATNGGTYNCGSYGGDGANGNVGGSCIIAGNLNVKGIELVATAGSGGAGGSGGNGEGSNGNGTNQAGAGGRGGDGGAGGVAIKVANTVTIKDSKCTIKAGAGGTAGEGGHGGEGAKKNNHDYGGNGGAGGTGGSGGNAIQCNEAEIACKNGSTFIGGNATKGGVGGAMGTGWKDSANDGKPGDSGSIGLAYKIASIKQLSNVSSTNGELV